MAAVRPEFRAGVLVFDPGDPVFGGAGLPRPAVRPVGRASACARGTTGAGSRPGGRTRASSPPRRSPALARARPLPSAGCRLRVRRPAPPPLPPAWRMAARRGTGTGRLARVRRRRRPRARPAACLVGPCQLWAEPRRRLCHPHLRRWSGAAARTWPGSPRGCGQPADGDGERADLAPLPRAAAPGIPVRAPVPPRRQDGQDQPVPHRTVIRELAASGAGSLLERTEQEWRDACPPPPGTRAAGRAADLRPPQGHHAGRGGRLGQRVPPRHLAAAPAGDRRPARAPCSSARSPSRG